jgi:hypothetical protein
MLTPRYCAQITTAVLTIPFSTNYTAEGGPTLKIDGWEPAEEGSYPVIIYMGASGLPHDVFVSFFVNLFGTFWEQEGGPAGLSETCGAIAAFVDFPDPLVLDGQVDDACELATTRAEAVFTKAGSALSTLCAMPKADCSKGAHQPRDPHLIWLAAARCTSASGLRFHTRDAPPPWPHRQSSCLRSRLSSFSAVMLRSEPPCSAHTGSLRHALAGVGIVGYTTGAVIGAVGANLLGLPYPITAMIIDQMGTEKTFAGSFSRMECMTNENIEPGLPKDKRLSVLSSTDSAIGTTTADTLRVQKEMSGYDCGDDFDCRQPNGAGYYLFDTESKTPPLAVAPPRPLSAP